MDIQQIIDEITTSECVKCKFGKVLIALKPLRDNPEPEAKTPAAPKSKLHPKTAVSKALKPAQSTENINSKRCRVCAKVKFLNDFPKNSGCADGHTNECKPCCAARQKKAAAKRTHKPAAIVETPEPQHSLATHPHECKVCGKRFLTFVGLGDHMTKRHAA
jgi:hypothetical protein